MKFHIREAEHRDYEAVCSLAFQLHTIHVSARPDIYKPTDKPMERQRYEEMIDGSTHLLYVMDDVQKHKVTGYAICRLDRVKGSHNIHDRAYLFIEEFIVDGSSRGDGAGTCLFHFIKSKAKELEVDSIDLNVAVFNKEAIAFYQKIGLMPKSLRMEYPVGHEPEVSRIEGND